MTGAGGGGRIGLVSISSLRWMTGAGVVSAAGAAGAAGEAGAAGAEDAGAATGAAAGGGAFLGLVADVAGESGKLASPPRVLRSGLGLRWCGWSEPGGRRSASVGILAVSSMVWTY